MKEGKRHAIAADIVFDGAALHRDGAVVIEGADIAALVPRRDLPPGIPLRAMPPGAWLAPGFIDTQVNGGGDVLFNDRPTPDGIAAIAAAHRRFGTTGLLPTLISDTREKMRRAREAVEAAMRRLPRRARHPFRGAVPVARACRACTIRRCSARRTMPDLALLTEQRGGATLVTLAPECVPSGFVASAGQGRRAGRARAFDGELRTDKRRAGRGSDRVHASVQRDAAARSARPRADRGGARRP